MPEFPTDYPNILARLQAIDPVTYNKTRNYLSGAVTKLSPYLTHGVFSTQEVGKVALAKASLQESETFLKELAWRDFYQATWKQLGTAILTDLKYPQPLNHFYLTPTAVVNGATGITVIDQSIEQLFQTGYLHNHSRLWIAMLCCNIARTGWWNPSCWMYYHLLDGDIASNTLSWQWVAGSYRKEPYIANQENINTYSGVVQHQTFLDVPYEELTKQVPKILQERSSLSLCTTLPKTSIPTLTGEVLLYHAWSLNPTWQKESILPRILVLEPEHFADFPISEKRLEFILGLAKNIPNLAVVVANFSELSTASPAAKFCFMQHPAVAHWRGLTEIQEPLFRVRNTITRDWSFSKFWSHSTITLKDVNHD